MEAMVEWAQTLSIILAMVVVGAAFWRDITHRIERLEDRVIAMDERLSAKITELSERVARLEGREQPSS